MKKTNRLIDFFAVIGPDNTFTCNDPEIEKEKDITTLEIINGFFNNIENFNKEESEEWIDLDGTRTIWLKISYSQRSVPPITHMEFMYIPMEGDNLKIPMNYECFPVPVKKFGEKNVQHGFGGQIKNYHLFKGSYDLTKLLDAEPKNGYSLVLCYRVQSKTNYSTAISHIKLVYGEKSKKLYKANYNPNDYHIFIPKDYKPLNLTFGVPEKNRMLCFKKKTDIFKISYMPKVLDKYPNEEFPEAIAMFCFPEGMYLYQNDSPSPKAFSFILTQSDGARIYGTTLCFFEPVPKELYKNIGHIDSSKVTVIGQKAICLISHYPYMNEFKRILKQLYRISLSFSDLPIERYISNIVNDIRAPIENGNFSIQCDIGSDSVIFNTGFQFPYLSEESLKNFFRVFDVERIIYLFGCVLLERKILLISKFKSLLTQVAECLTGLIYPFMWTHVLIPILPENLKSYVEAPVPFIIGIASENKTGEDNNNALKPNDTIRVYLDTSDLIFIDNLPPFPEKAINQLRKRLSSYENFHKSKSKDILENIDSAFDIAILDIDPNENFNAYEIRDAFFEFNTSYLKDYRKYVSGLNQKKIVSSDFSELFNAKAFLEANKSQKQGSFLYKLIETSLFAYFIESCLYIQSNIDFTFLNNALKMKREKKKPIILQPEKAHKIIPCPQPTDQNLPVKKAPYRYMIFPKLNPEYFAKPLFQMESVIEGNKSVDKIGDLDSLDENKWAKLLLESIYTLWYVIFNIRIKLVYNENYSFLTEYAHFMLDDMRKKGLIPNITILRCLIEAIGYYFADKQDILKEIVKLMNQEKIDSMNLHGAYISAVSNGRSLKKESEKINKSKTQIEYDDEDMDEKPEEKNIGKKFSSDHQGQIPKIKKNSNPLLSQFDNIILSFDDNCPHCDRQMYPEEIFSGWKKSYQEYVTSCPSCKKGFSSCLKIIEFQGENSKSITVNLLSPIVVRKELENINHHIGGKNIFNESFQQNQQHRVIFWNIYFYLNLIKAPTFILDKNENPEFIEENSKNIFKEMKLSKPSKTMVMQAGNSSANGFSWKDGSIDKNITPNSPQLTILSNNQKSMQSPNFSNLTVPANKASIINNLAAEKNNMANNSIKKVFGNLIKEFKIINENKLNSIKSNQI